ncbi:MAG: hypothetical protein D6686_03705 [Alphaproteobacteria bacterium]|nr:MAG: hypothetical protein D6686_03705 [Alphaproteobacteria bacterium]
MLNPTMVEIAAVDDSGQLQPLPPERARREGLQLIVVAVALSSPAGILLTRAAEAGGGGAWSLPAVLPRWGEHGATAAARLMRGSFGLGGLALRRAGGARYRADPVPGATAERGLVQLFRAELASPDLPAGGDGGLRWLAPAALAAELAADPRRFGPLLRAVAAAGTLDAWAAPGGEGA